MLKWLFNVSAARRVFKTEWVEDLPASAEKYTVYIVGGRRFPFNIAIPCPRPACRRVIQLDISDQVLKTKRWRVNEEGDGSLSLSPSVHLTGLPCRCHYWLRKSRIVWCETPPIFVPKANRNDSQN